jgi:hypothetical protein
MCEPPPFDKARETVDPDRLLPGEEMSDSSPEAVARWIGIYQELLAAKQALIDSLAERLPGRFEEARMELENFDLAIIQTQVARFRRRLAYWQSRARGRAD